MQLIERTYWFKPTFLGLFITCMISLIPIHPIKKKKQTKNLENKLKKPHLFYSNYCIFYVLDRCFTCPKLQITNFFSILNCSVTDYSQTHLLKIATLLFLWILPVGNLVIVQRGTLSLFMSGTSGG